MNKTPIDRYIETFPQEVRAILLSLRHTIKMEAPEAEETIKYRMPTFVLNGNLVHFAVFKHHIGFYPTPSGIAAFQEEFSGYKTSKGAIQFPLNKPLPFSLIRKIVQFRVREQRIKNKLMKNKQEKPQ